MIGEGGTDKANMLWRVTKKVRDKVNKHIYGGIAAISTPV